MNDTVSRRHDFEVGEGGLSPLEESKSFDVSIELDLFVAVLGVRGTGDINLDGVINYEINLAKWVDFVGVTAERLHGRAHSSEVHNSGHTGEVLEEHTCGLERDLTVGLGGHFPVKDCLNIGG
jgi:hypothetical protein